MEVGENSKNRIYCISSALSAFLAVANARENNFKNPYFLIDAMAINEIRKAKILEIFSLHDTYKLIDLSSIALGGSENKPTTYKNFIRRIKSKPIIKEFYRFLFEIKKKQDNQKLSERIKKYLKKDFDNLEVYTQPNLVVFDSLTKLFQDSQIHLIEHGLGDYLDIVNKKRDHYPFHCIFNNEWSVYSKQKCYSYIGADSFIDMTDTFLENNPFYSQYIEKILSPHSHVHLICLQSFEQFGIGETFWKEFLETTFSLGLIKPNDLILLKPHHFQNKEMIEKVIESIGRPDLNFKIIDSDQINNIPIEILFGSMRPKIISVISPFSSSIFYLSKLFNGNSIHFIYDFKIFNKYINQAPEIYRVRWKEFEHQVEEVFGRECSSLKDLLK